MVRFAVVLLTLAACVHPHEVFCGIHPPPCAANLRGRLIGCVVDSKTGAPLEGAHVFVNDRQDYGRGGGVSDARGAWSANAEGTDFVLDTEVGGVQVRESVHVPKGARCVVPTIRIHPYPPQPPEVI